MIPLMEKEIVDKQHWLDQESFMDILSLSQALPGIFAANMAANIGYRLRGLRGAVTAVLGNIIAPILMILAIAIFFRQFSENQWVEAAFKGIRPAVVALIAAPVFTMAKTAKLSWRNAWIPIVASLLIYLLGFSPIWIIIGTAMGGFIYGKFIERRKEA